MDLWAKAGCIRVANRNEATVDLGGWKLQDRAGNEFRLVGKVPGWGRLTVKMTEPSMPLNNDGDEVVLVDPDGVVRNHVAYGGREVRSGRWIEFGGDGSDARADPKSDQRLDNLDNDAASILRQLPGIVQVTRHGPQGRPSHRVVHLLDWHLVPKDRQVRHPSRLPLVETPASVVYLLRPTGGCRSPWGSPEKDRNILLGHLPIRSLILRNSPSTIPGPSSRGWAPSAL